LGHLGHIASLSDLPSDKTIASLVKEAMKRNESGVKSPRVMTKKALLRVPAYFRSAVCANKKALATLEAFAPSHRRAYVEWVTEAKTEVTRTKRLKTTVEWLAAGKRHNWKYEQR